MSTVAFGKVQIVQDLAHQASGISSLAENERECGSATIVGKILKRSFADDALTVMGYCGAGR